jgi:hypothetical protein
MRDPVEKMPKYPAAIIIERPEQLYPQGTEITRANPYL